MARTQLNIKVEPELLQRAKAHATQQGKTLTEFLTELLEAAVKDQPSNVEARLNRIEKHLGL
jgi:predicted HicB family RNase H-like nuclease